MNSRHMTMEDRKRMTSKEPYGGCGVKFGTIFPGVRDQYRSSEVTGGSGLSLDTVQCRTQHAHGNSFHIKKSENEVMDLVKKLWLVFLVLVLRLLVWVY